MKRNSPSFPLSFLALWLALLVQATCVLGEESDQSEQTQESDKNMIIKVTNQCSSTKLTFVNTMYVGKWFAPTKYDRPPLNGTGTLEPLQSFQIGVSSLSRKDNFAAGQILLLLPKMDHSKETTLGVGLNFILPVYGHHALLDEIFDSRLNEAKIEYTMQEMRMTSVVASIHCDKTS